MPVKLMECLDWREKDSSKTLAALAEECRERKIILEALWTYTSGKGKKVAVIAKEADKLRNVLRDMGLKANRSKVLYVTGREKRGAAIKALAKLTEANVPVDCSDVLASDGHFGAALWVKDRYLRKARVVLGA